MAGSPDVLHAAATPEARPRNIIFVVADGIKPSVLPLTEYFHSTSGESAYCGGR
jgi:hypothetical protein